jgi:hypothetical protein
MYAFLTHVKRQGGWEYNYSYMFQKGAKADFLEQSLGMHLRLSKSFLRVVHRVCLNAAHYIVSGGEQRAGYPLKRTGEKRGKKTKTQYRTREGYSDYVLTQPVTIDLVEHVRKYATGASRAITVSYLRCGHWKQQPYGPRNSLRRPKFIEPHWVNRKDGTPIAVREHHMRDTK